MNRILIHVEGETEETFVNEVIAPHLCNFGIESTQARLLGNARQRSRRGGIQGWGPSKQDLLRHIRADPGCCCTTMVDYYALPQEEGKGWPGRKQAGLLPFEQKGRTIAEAIFDDMNDTMGGYLHPDRFVPFVMMHEFEALLFSDCAAFGNEIGRSDLIPAFQAIRDEFSSPEEINDSPQTAPSKRVINLVPGYQKPLLGNLAALGIGLDAIRAECPHFNNWLSKLEALPASDNNE